MIKALVVLSAMVIFSNASAQEKRYRQFIMVNANTYLPLGSDKERYPIVGYNKDYDPKLLIGGLGLGISTIVDYKTSYKIKVQANAQRRVYWEEEIHYRDDQNRDMGTFRSGSADLVLNLMGTFHKKISDKFSIGTGLAADAMMMSASRKPDFNGNDRDKMLSLNRHYKRIMPVLPLELSMEFKKILLNLRYDIGLLNKFRSDLAKHKKDYYSVLSFEAGFRIN
jgi:hypothetical protein